MGKGIKGSKDIGKDINGYGYMEVRIIRGLITIIKVIYSKKD
jgi:hypothetical protein